MKAPILSAFAEKLPGNVEKRYSVPDGQENNLYTHSGGATPIAHNLKPGKGINKENGYPLAADALASRISRYLFEYLEGFHIPTRYVRKVSGNEVPAHDLGLAMIPLAVKVYNAPTSSLASRLPFKEGHPLEFPVFEHYYRDPEKGLAWANEHHFAALGTLSLEEFKQINRLASKVNAVLRGFCDRRRLILAEITLEFGRDKHQLRLGGELTPATCLFLDAGGDAGARNYFNDETRDAAERYGKLLDRLLFKV